MFTALILLIAMGLSWVPIGAVVGVAGILLGCIR